MFRKRARASVVRFRDVNLVEGASYFKPILEIRIPDNHVMIL